MTSVLFLNFSSGRSLPSISSAIIFHWPWSLASSFLATLFSVPAVRKRIASSARGRFRFIVAPSVAVSRSRGSCILCKERFLIEEVPSMSRRFLLVSAVLSGLLLPGSVRADEPSEERGKKALLERAFNPAPWTFTAFNNLWQHWGTPAKEAP